MPTPPAAAEQALDFLRQFGTASIAHPGGTLLAHLQRVRERLSLWDARPALQLAGLCHAFYGTDGFSTALLPLDRRMELAGIIGTEAEAIVYLYGSCDRKATYPTLTDTAGAFHDRFTGLTHMPQPRHRRDFAELTAANELDLACVDGVFRQRHGPELLALFTRFRNLLTRDAWHECRQVLASSPPPLTGSAR